MSDTLRPMVTVATLEHFPSIRAALIVLPFVQVDGDRALGEHVLQMVSIIAWTEIRGGL